ncbi:CHAT domain-containing protein [Streptomyces sp. NBC_00829]|uniref:CHAT domain-containing protein n=1 Tax=Streptomyces sp. NBC_00829 TaxID=2903679 RepID=UPI0038705AAB|nr:CHAT domain-containing protein [Streptomyces sp. NBC_00829]
MKNSPDDQPEHQNQAGQPADPIDPVVAVRPLPRFWSSQHLPPATGGNVLVFATAQDTYDMYVPPDRPGFRDVAGRRYTSVYVVNMRDHHLRLELLLPSEQETFSFRAVLYLIWRVSDPVAWVASGQRDAAALLDAEIHELARRVSPSFGREESEHLAGELERRIEQTELLAAVGLTVRGQLTITPSASMGEGERHARETSSRAFLLEALHGESLETVRLWQEESRQRQLAERQRQLVEHQRLAGQHRLEELKRQRQRLTHELEQLKQEVPEGHARAEDLKRQRQALTYELEQLEQEVRRHGRLMRGPAALAFSGGPPSAPLDVARLLFEIEPRRLVAELAEQASPAREVPLQVQITCGGEAGVALRAFAIPAEGARVLITVHAPGMLALGDLQQEVLVEAGRDSDVLRFGLRTMRPGLHSVTVRAFRGGSFLGELRMQMSVEAGVPARDGPPRSAPLESLAFDPGEVTLQVLKAADGTYTFQLLSETSYAPEAFKVRAGDPRQAVEDIYRELRAVAAAASDGTDAKEVREQLRDLGVALWRAAVPAGVRNHFWQEAGRIRAFTVLGEHDFVPWELLYPLDGTQEGDGFLAEWLPIVRRVFGQNRVRQLVLPQATFVVPPGSPPEAELEVTALRARFGSEVAYGGTLTRRAEVRSLVRGGMAGLLHFACHNAFTDAGSRVVMADGAFSPRDLSYAEGAGALRATRPLVFFNACRSAGQVDWYSSSLGWAPKFLEAGAGAFVGTLWPVRSDSALTFADAFYTHLVTDGLPLGEASMKARQAIRDRQGDPTWLAYAVYGSPAARATTA